MREISVHELSLAVEQLLVESNLRIGRDISGALESALPREASPVGRSVLEQLLENYRIAAQEDIPFCQDTGMAVLFIDLGQEVRFIGGDFTEAVNEGVRRAYCDHYLRKSVVADPLFERKNTGDNTPAVVHLRLVPGDRIHILAAPKGFGSENMSALKMCKPSEGVSGVEDFVVDTVRRAGPNPCPPIVVGVGVGGTMELACQLAKRAVARGVGIPSGHPDYAALEARLLEKINALGIGPGGTGGTTTALAVGIEYAPTHIAGLPVAVNICCHAARHGEVIL